MRRYLASVSRQTDKFAKEYGHGGGKDLFGKGQRSGEATPGQEKVG